MAEEHCNISMFSEAILQSTSMTKNIGRQDAKDNMSCKVCIRVGFPEEKSGDRKDSSLCSCSIWKRLSVPQIAEIRASLEPN